MVDTCVCVIFLMINNKRKTRVCVIFLMINDKRETRVCVSARCPSKHTATQHNNNYQKTTKRLKTPDNRSVADANESDTVLGRKGGGGGMLFLS